MGLFSFLRKNKQESASGDGEFYSRPDEESATVRARGKRKDPHSNKPLDPVLPEKKRARRRLVGAIALVLAAIIGLPMIFDAEPKPVSDDITIQIPAKDKLTSKAINGGMPIASAASKVAGSATLDAKEEIVSDTGSGNAALTAVTVSAVAATAVSAVAKNKEAGSKSVAAAQPVDDEKVTTAPVAKSEGKTEGKSEPKQADKRAPKVESKTESKSSYAADLKQKDASTSTEKAGGIKPVADTKKGKFVLQVAALVTQEKINELLATLKKAGFTPFTQKVATVSGESTRIRVGPFATKEDVDKARAKLIKLGLNGTPVQSGH